MHHHNTCRDFSFSMYASRWSTISRKSSGFSSTRGDHLPALKVLLAQEKQRLEEIDALIRTMSLEELVAIVMLDVEDSNDHSTTD